MHFTSSYAKDFWNLYAKVRHNQTNNEKNRTRFRLTNNVY